MHSKYYGWPTRKGLLTIETNKQTPCFWDLCLNGVPIEEGYIDPEEAVADASNADLGTETKCAILRGMHIPWDINQWFTSPIPSPSNIHQNNN